MKTIATIAALLAVIALAPSAMAQTPDVQDEQTLSQAVEGNTSGGEGGGAGLLFAGRRRFVFAAPAVVVQTNLFVPRRVFVPAPALFGVGLYGGVGYGVGVNTFGAYGGFGAGFRAGCGY